MPFQTPILKQQLLIQGLLLIFFSYFSAKRGFRGGSRGKESAWNVGDPGSVPGLERSTGEGNDNPLQCSCLGNPMDRVAWWAKVRHVTNSQTQLNTLTLIQNACLVWRQNSLGMCS